MNDETNAKAWYERCYRRMLVDMHIGDWDERFLADYDPRKMAELYESAGLTSVMFYCQSHVGLCYWPTRTGKMHAGLKGRDVVGEMAEELKKRGIAACAYYSVIFNVWAFREHPEWRMEPATAPPSEAFSSGRPGLCCPNNPGYREFALAQTRELVTGYDFDGFFFDMTFWPTICCCGHCRERYRREAGKEFPRVVDWTSRDWCEFQAARERWMDEFAHDLTAEVKDVKPGMSVHHNFACAFHNWVRGLPLGSARHHDFLGADFYGGRDEQLMVSKVMLNLAENRPAEFMTSLSPNLRFHARLKPYDQTETEAFASTLFSSAFMFIDAINPSGAINPAHFDLVRRLYGKTAPYEPYLGGEPVEDIAIYYSSDSKMDFAENGTPLSGARGKGSDYPHARAVRGACRILQRAHLPFGVITRRQLCDLPRYKVLVLPNVLRMDSEEAEAFREYAGDGGRLYASCFTSLTETRGVRHDDFMLADLFGCHASGEVGGFFAYLKPRDAGVARAIAPQGYLCLVPATGKGWDPGGTRVSALRLHERVEGKVLGTLALPYHHPARGTVFDNDWASFHSWPPFSEKEAPVLVHHEFGKGEVVYSAADMECFESAASDALFASLIRMLVDEPLAYSAEAHPAVWMNVFYQPESRRFLIGFLNYQNDLPPLPVEQVAFTLRPIKGRKFSRLVRIPDESPIPFEVDASGALHARVENLEVFQMLAADTS